MIVCLHGRLAPLLMPLFVLPVALAIGCSGATTDDNAEGASSAIGSVPAYDAVIRTGTKVTTQSVPTAQVSASTHLIGWIPRIAVGGSAKTLLTVGRWAEIRASDGSQPFTHAQVMSDTGAIAFTSPPPPPPPAPVVVAVADAGADGSADAAADAGHVDAGHPATPAAPPASGSRKLIVKLTLDGGVDLDIKALASQGADNIVTVSFTNTSAYTHWFAGTILLPGKLVMDIKLVPYNGGTIVDATTRVKLEQMEDRAPALTASIAAIFDWLKTNAR